MIPRETEEIIRLGSYKRIITGEAAVGENYFVAEGQPLLGT
jgi:hypothetical protein